MAYDPFTNKLLTPFTLPSIWNDEDIPLSSMTNNLSISEDESQVYVEASIPGVNPDDVELTFHDGYLWIRGEAKEEESKKKKYYRQATRSFSYRVAVPGELDLTLDPEATYKHGVMTVAFKKAPQLQPKKIQLKSKVE